MSHTVTPVLCKQEASRLLGLTFKMHWLNQLKQNERILCTPQDRIKYCSAYFSKVVKIIMGNNKDFCCYFSLFNRFFPKLPSFFPKSIMNERKQSKKAHMISPFLAHITGLVYAKLSSSHLRIIIFKLTRL